VSNRRKQLRKQAAIQREVKRAVAKALAVSASKPTQGKKIKPWLTAGKVLLGTVGLLSTFLGFAVLLPDVEVTQLEVINARDQLSFPLQLKNAGLLPLTDIQVEWRNFEAHQTSQGETHLKGGNIGNSRAALPRLGRRQTATIPPPGWIFDTPTWEYATVEIHVKFKHLWIPGTHRFRLQGRRVQNQLRWYVQPA
jgi:hypothetical protein